MTSSASNSEPYDEFYASVKLVSGEEVLCVVMIDEPKSQPDKIIIDNPVLCKEVRAPGTNIPMGFKFEPWMKMTDDNTFVLSMDRVVTISQIQSKEIIDTYKSMIDLGMSGASHPDITKQMGYISSVDRARKVLEKMYKDEPKGTP